MTPFPRRVRCLGTRYRLIKTRYLGGATYAAEDRSTYLRMGTRKALQAEAGANRWLARHGHPVAAIVATGLVDGERAFLVERSLGERTCGDAFAAARPGPAPPSAVDDYDRVVLAHLAAQLRAPAPGPVDAARLLRWRSVVRHDPPSPTVRQACARALARVAHLPARLSHGDLNPFNVLPGGVIDLELACPAPLGYDVVTSAYFDRFWPDRMLAYRLDDAVVDAHLRRAADAAAAAGLADLLRHRDDFLLIKAVWATARHEPDAGDPTRDGDLWAWRSRVREWTAREYLAGRPIDTGRFAEVGR